MVYHPAMRIFLLWSTVGPRALTATLPEVRSALTARFGPLFADPLEFHERETACARLLVAEIPETCWKPASCQTDGTTWAFAPDYPLNAHTVLAANGQRVPDLEPLPALGRALADPAHAPALLEALVPPFSLVWTGTGEHEIHVQTDALGQAAMFEARVGGGFALTNHVGALHALGMTLDPVPEEWATRFSIGWFPLDMTGFRDVRCSDPGTRVRFHAGGVDVSTLDALSAWVNPPDMTPEQCLELARTSLMETSRSVLPLWDRPTAGLSGGWDSRAVCSALRSVGADLDYRVRGHPERFDVLIAHKLSEMSGLGIRVKTGGGQPPGNAADTARSICGALLWQMGGMPAKRHKTLLVKHPRMKRGTVNVMGQHGGLGKSDFVRDTQALEHPPESWEERLIDFAMQTGPPNLRRDHDEFIRDAVRRSYRAADRYGLDGLGALHFYYLNEFTRRWGSATVTSQTGIVFAPILNPGFIQAAYAYPPEEVWTKPFHKHVIGTLAPDWAAVPYTDTVTEDDITSGRIPPLPDGLVKTPEEDPAHKAKGRHRKFHQKYFWKYSAADLVEEARKADGFWPLVIDPDRFDEGLPKRADEVVIAHLLPKVLSEANPVDE